MLQVRFVIATFAFALTMPIPRNTRPPIERSINPNTCSTRQRIFDLERLFCFCSSFNDCGDNENLFHILSYFCTKIQNNLLISKRLIYRTSHLQMYPFIFITLPTANIQPPPFPSKHSAIFIFSLLSSVLSPQSVFFAVHPPGRK